MGRGARLTFVIVGAKKLFDISHDARPRAIGQWAVGQFSHRPPPPAKPQQTRGQELRVVGRQRVADTALHALNRYMRSADAQPRRLLAIARELGGQRRLTDALEAMMS